MAGAGTNDAEPRCEACAKAMKLAVERTSGPLSPEGELALQEHIGACGRCRGQVRALTEACAVVGGALGTRTSDEQAALARVRRTLRAANRPHLGVRIALAGAGAFAVLLLVLGLVVIVAALSGDGGGEERQVSRNWVLPMDRDLQEVWTDVSRLAQTRQVRPVDVLLGTQDADTPPPNSLVPEWKTLRERREEESRRLYRIDSRIRRLGEEIAQF